MTSTPAAGQRVVVFGATSAIAEAMVRRLAKRGARFALIARNTHKLDALSADLQRCHGADVVAFTSQADLDKVENHLALVTTAAEAMGGFDLAILAHGSLPNQGVCEKDIAVALAQLHTNAISTVSLCAHLANVLAVQRSGTLAVLTSVAGDRGRMSNHVYGSAKALVSRYLEGTRARLWPAGIAVIDLRPGFVITPMTASFDRRSALWSTADKVAALALDAIDKRRDIAYLPGFWRWIMLLVRLIPENVFKRLKI